ncbi:hypothetical protein [Fluviicola sp.]|uniref:hypothetical protein n=1 Tax=Fluviicola sp. TaxID=1917219 RepID=UPI00260A9089|nr:hypothetical protein [Fluviicola sp.]
MRLLLLAALASAFAATATYAHTRCAHHTPVYGSISSDTLSSDSLQKLYQRIDLLSVFELNKMRESYIYKNRTQPSNQNKQILLYVEERLKLAK